MALLAAGEGSSQTSRIGIEYLLSTQDSDGTWSEPYFTGTGFPGYGVGQALPDYLRPDDPGYQGNELSAGYAARIVQLRWPCLASTEALFPV